MSKAREKLASFGHPDMNPKIKLLKTKEIKTLLGGRLAQLANFFPCLKIRLISLFSALSNSQEGSGIFTESQVFTCFGSLWT